MHGWEEDGDLKLQYKGPCSMCGKVDWYEESREVYFGDGSKGGVMACPAAACRDRVFFGTAWCKAHEHLVTVYVLDLDEDPPPNHKYIRGRDTFVPHYDGSWY